MGNIVIVKSNRPLEAVQFKDTEQGIKDVTAFVNSFIDSRGRWYVVRRGEAVDVRHDCSTHIYSDHALYPNCWLIWDCIDGKLELAADEDFTKLYSVVV